MAPRWHASVTSKSPSATPIEAQARREPWAPGALPSSKLPATISQQSTRRTSARPRFTNYPLSAAVKNDEIVPLSQFLGINRNIPSVTTSQRAPIGGSGIRRAGFRLVSVRDLGSGLDSWRCDGNARSWVSGFATLHSERSSAGEDRGDGLVGSNEWWSGRLGSGLRRSSFGRRLVGLG